MMQSIRSGKGVPDRIANAPELQLGLELYIQAFFDLDSERVEATSAIPWLSIRQYALAFDLDEEQTEELFFFVKKLDGFHLKRLAAKLDIK